MKKNKAQIVQNNSFTEFLIYHTPNGNVKVEIFLHNENIWLTRAKIGELFGVDRSVVSKHLKNIFLTNELIENTVSAKIAHTADDGKCFVETEYEKYQLIQDKVFESDFDRHLIEQLKS